MDSFASSEVFAELPYTIVKIGGKPSWKHREDSEQGYRFLAETAPTSQASCGRGCGEKIKKGSVRFGEAMKWNGGENGLVSAYKHATCCRLPSGVPFDPTEVYGLGALSEEDRAIAVAELSSTEIPEHLKAIDPEDPAFIGAKQLERVKAPETVALSLLPYQEEGFGWMLAQEEGTHGSVKGGILADEMGMGKTLQTICLLCKDKETPVAKESVPSTAAAAAVAVATTNNNKGKERKAKSTTAVATTAAASPAAAAEKETPPPCAAAESPTPSPPALMPGPTLVVVPSSAMWQWHDEIARSTSPNALKVYMYYGGKRNAPSASFLASSSASSSSSSSSPSMAAPLPVPSSFAALDGVDVVITTYPVLEYEYRSQFDKCKVRCPFCAKAQLPRKLELHLKYFCGPHSSRTAKQALTERSSSGQSKATITKGLKSLGVVGDAGGGVDNEDGSDDDGDGGEKDGKAGGGKTSSGGGRRQGKKSSAEKEKEKTKPKLPKRPRKSKSAYILWKESVLKVQPPKNASESSASGGGGDGNNTSASSTVDCASTSTTTTDDSGGSSNTTTDSSSSGSSGGVSGDLLKQWKSMEVACSERVKFEELAIMDKGRYEKEAAEYEAALALVPTTMSDLPTPTTTMSDDDDDDEKVSASTAQKIKKRNKDGASSSSSSSKLASDTASTKKKGKKGSFGPSVPSISNIYRGLMQEAQREGEIQNMYERIESSRTEGGAPAASSTKDGEEDDADDDEGGERQVRDTGTAAATKATLTGVAAAVAAVKPLTTEEGGGSLLGRRVRVASGAAYFEGTVTAFASPYWEVTYDDGDTEEFEVADLLPNLLPPSPAPTEAVAEEQAGAGSGAVGAAGKKKEAKKLTANTVPKQSRALKELSDTLASGCRDSAPSQVGQGKRGRSAAAAAAAATAGRDEDEDVKATQSIKTKKTKKAKKTKKEEEEEEEEAVAATPKGRNGLSGTGKKEVKTPEAKKPKKSADSSTKKKGKRKSATKGKGGNDGDESDGSSWSGEDSKGGGGSKGGDEGSDEGSDAGGRECEESAKSKRKKGRLDAIAALVAAAVKKRDDEAERVSSLQRRKEEKEEEDAAAAAAEDGDDDEDEEGNAVSNGGGGGKRGNASSKKTRQTLPSKTSKSADEKTKNKNVKKKKKKLTAPADEEEEGVASEEEGGGASGEEEGGLSSMFRGGSKGKHESATAGKRKKQALPGKKDSAESSPAPKAKKKTAGVGGGGAGDDDGDSDFSGDDGDGGDGGGALQQRSPRPHSSPLQRKKSQSKAFPSSFAAAGVVVDGDGVDLAQSLLHCVRWRRIVLDEAHKIKGRTNSTAKSANALQGERRWCLTGTPIQNRVSELYGLVRFLRHDPYAYYCCRIKGCECKKIEWQFGERGAGCVDCGHSPMSHGAHFNQRVLNPITKCGYSGAGATAMLRLRTELLNPLMLRRTKEERAQDLQLPPLVVKVQLVELDAAERDFYECVYKRTQAKFDNYVQKGAVLHNYAHIFELLSRLRQALDHPYLVIHGPSAHKDTAQAAAAKGDSDVCGLCQLDIDKAKDCAVAQCRHTFHRDCILDFIEDAKESAAAAAATAKRGKPPAAAAAEAAVGGGVGNSAKKKRGTSKKNSVGGDDDDDADACACPVCFQPLTLTLDIRGADDDDDDDDDEDGGDEGNRRKAVKTSSKKSKSSKEAEKPAATASATAGNKRKAAATSAATGHDDDDDGGLSGSSAAAAPSTQTPPSPSAAGECKACFDAPRDALYLPCGHIVLCMACTSRLTTKACPLCRAKITQVVKAKNQNQNQQIMEQEPFSSSSTSSTSFTPSSSSSSSSSTAVVVAANKPVPVVGSGVTVGRNSILQRLDMASWQTSSKVEAVANAVEALVGADPTDKAIVFSQYRTMLDLVEWRLRGLKGVEVVKLMGDMPLSERRSVLAAFKANPAIKVILMSLKAGGEGLNLQEANHVFLLEPWWNPAVEMQAVHRAYRIGQLKAVHATRFITRDSVEEKMLQLQEKKQLVFEGTMDGSSSSLAKLTAEDLAFLFHS